MVSGVDDVGSHSASSVCVFACVCAHVCVSMVIFVERAECVRARTRVCVSRMARVRGRRQETPTCPSALIPPKSPAGDSKLTHYYF